MFSSRVRKIGFKLVVAVTLQAALVVGGCGNDGGGSCPLGSDGCKCYPNGACDDGLECNKEGACQPESCPEGDLGCACYSNSTCNVGDDGTQLECKDGKCVKPEPCPEGKEGCTCGEGDSCDDGLLCRDGKCEPLGCIPGTIGCVCDDNGECAADNAYCDNDGWCKLDECPSGSEGCACADGDRCGVNSRGEQMECKDGKCIAPSCTPGETGCTCADGSGCNEPTDECKDGFCQPSDCVPGELNCPCAGGGCTPGLSCRDGVICVDNTGYRGGPCFEDGTCRDGNRCQNDVCVPCLEGSLDCTCDDDGECTAGLKCKDDLCIEPQGPQAPDDPKCYTPCERDMVADDGTFRKCSSEGLMEGCLSGQVCVDGSCVEQGEEPAGCGDDMDCPDFQQCLEGKCYSDCAADYDCPDGYSCYRHTCKLSCSATDKTTCSEGTSCVTQDGDNGHCLQMKEPEGEQKQSVDGSFELSDDTLAFSNVNTTEKIKIINNSAKFEKFTVRKRKHVLYLSDGSNERMDDPAGDGKECEPTKDCPLVWLSIGPEGQTDKVQSFEIGIEGNGGEAVIQIGDADGTSAPKWDGTIEVMNKDLGVQSIIMTYTEKPEGRWSGNIAYFAQFGDWKLDQWIEDPATTPVSQVGNALVRRWAAFKSGNIDYDEFLAVLKATKTGSWSWPSVMKNCPATPNGACYLYDINQSGVVVYTEDNKANPIPTGVTELPFSMNLYMPDPDGAPEHMEGRIESQIALQYAGNPKVTLEFDNPTNQCDTTAGGACLLFIKDFNFDVYVGGRYQTESSDSDCSRRAGDGYELVKIPWIVPGFQRATEEDGDTGLLYRYECRDTMLPFDDGSHPLPDELKSANLALSASNPIPDGRTRRRTITLIDGALINQTRLFLLIKETFESFLPGDEQPFSAYGYVIMEKESTDLDTSDKNGDSVPDAYEGSVPSDNRTEPDDILDITCSPDLVEKVLGYGNDTIDDGTEADRMVHGLIEGVVPSGTPSFIDKDSAERVHYLCVLDTGESFFDGGDGNYTDPYDGAPPPNNDKCNFDNADDNPHDRDNSCDDGGPGSDTSICPLGTDVTDCGTRSAGDKDSRRPCPAGSEVIFFTVDKSSMSQGDIAKEPCQTDLNCRKTLNKWREDPNSPLVQYEPSWRCAVQGEVYCSENKLDLREGKLFYESTEEKAAFQPLYAKIESAFRYKTRFRSRTGKNVGFAPQICIPDSDQIPYCYDPQEIDEIRERIDCLLSIWKEFHENLDTTAGSTRDMLDNFLCSDMAYTEACHSGMNQSYVHDGFERLYAELLVMMGDESYTKAFASRFDLANSNAVSFEGTLFEPGGINLSGAAGYEMYSLYQAVEYYQEALDRFYSMSPLIWMALDYGDHDQHPRNFVTPETVTWYFERLIRASTQKSRAFSQIAKRYQNFNRPDLARSVIERAYTATYIEGVVLARLMLTISDKLKSEDKPQVIQALEQGQRLYRMAMLDMHNMYSSITENINFFGLPPDYIPFPALNNREDNAFEVIIARAKNKMQVAKIREEEALSRGRSFDTDTEEFQAELVRLRNTYEDQLGEICGTFQGSDGKIYPAIERYAYLNDKASKLGDPCGFMGNGTVYEAMAQLEMAQVDLKKVRVSMDNTLKEVEIERKRVEAQCDRVVSLADYTYEQSGRVNNLQSDVRWMQFGISRIERTLEAVSTISSLMKCSVGFSTDCVSAGLALGVFCVAKAAGEIGIGVLEGFIAAKQNEIDNIQRETAKWQTLTECDAAAIDGNARMATILLRIKEQQLEALRAEYQVRLAMAEIQQQLNKAKRLEQQLAEAQQYAINVQAARNDPNVRIYRNDAYINADISFEDAMREAYRATKVFEYYTSQSYAEQEKLYLIRMVQYGDYNLENYLTDLENAFYEFEENYGMPDTRVEILSLRDDIMKIPRLDENGKSIPQSKRITMMRGKLSDASLLDENGYLTIPFYTTLDELSPLTRNHKILYMEGEIIGSGVGDTIGRLYVRQQGTSVVFGVTGEKSYYRFPERIAVLNPFFNGNRVFTPEIYKNYRMRDRPFVNTSWELVLNQKDEKANQDIDLNSITDIRLYIYYTDFTEL